MFTVEHKQTDAGLQLIIHSNAIEDPSCPATSLPAPNRSSLIITISSSTSGVGLGVMPSSPTNDVTLRTCYTEYKRLRPLKPTTIRGYDRVVFKYLDVWLDTPLTRISDDDVLTVHKALRESSGVAQAALTLRVFKALHGFAAFKYGIPAKDWARFLRYSGVRTGVARRTTVIPKLRVNAWLSAVWELGKTPAERTARDIFLVGLFTGLRKNEIMRLAWADVDLPARLLQIPQTKNGTPHTLPLDRFLTDLFRRRKTEVGGVYVFPGKSGDHPVRDIDDMTAVVTKASGVKFTLHDLRRTFATAGAEVGLSTYILKRLLNHKSGRHDVTDGYVISSPDMLRDALGKIGDALDKNRGKRVPKTEPCTATGV